MHSKTVYKLLKPVMPYYFRLFNWVAATRLQKNDLDIRVIHTHIVSVLTTGMLMWSYAFLAIFTIDHPLPGIVGITASLIHMLSPGLFVFFNSGVLVCSVMLGAGMAHQVCFGWFSGGFESPLLIWLGILPMLAGIVAGRWGVALWSSLTIVVASLLLYLQLQDYPFPHHISEIGLLTAQALLVFGWIFLSTVVIAVHLLLQEQHERKLTESKRNINDLLQVLTHDLNTPMSVISMGLPALQNSGVKDQRQAINMVGQAHDCMADIIGDVRRLHALEHDGYKIQCRPYSLNQSVNTVSALLQSKMAQKRINLRYDFNANQSLMLWVDPNIFNYQIMVNIVSNAIKFSFSGSRLDIEATKQDHHIRLCIRDYGIGMPEEMVNQLFDADSKTSRPGTQGEKSTGYGMLIMSRSLHRLQGKITVESNEQPTASGTTGTKFILDIPTMK